jgi:hypothetical protein
LGTDRHVECGRNEGTGTRNEAKRWWSGCRDRGKIGVGRPSHGECVVGSAADPALFLELEGHEKAQSVRTLSSIKFKQGSWSARLRPAWNRPARNKKCRDSTGQGGKNCQLKQEHRSFGSATAINTSQQRK